MIKKKLLRTEEDRSVRFYEKDGWTLEDLQSFLQEPVNEDNQSWILPLTPEGLPDDPYYMFRPGVAKVIILDEIFKHISAVDRRVFEYPYDSNREYLKKLWQIVDSPEETQKVLEDISIEENQTIDDGPTNIEEIK